MKYVFDEKGNKPKNAKNIEYVIDNECFVCISHPKSTNQSGHIKITRNGIGKGLHRYIYELYNGHIGEGFVIMHTCDNPSCINPEHLKVGTHKENSLDMVSKGRNFSNFKLSTNQILEIKSYLLENNGEKLKDKYKYLSEKYNVSEKTIRRIKGNEIPMKGRS